MWASTALLRLLLFCVAGRMGSSLLQAEDRKPYTSDTILADANENAFLKTAIPSDRSPDTVFFEDFESGQGDWVHGDIREMNGCMWHTTGFNAFDGTSWWCGHPDYDGYRNKWYQILTTPDIDLTQADSPRLTFMHFYGTEYDETKPPEENPWDGCHVRCSTDGGQSFQLITPVGGYDPPDSLWVWEYHLEHIPGGMPGWHGLSDGWVQATFDLSAFKGENIVLQFIFASDAAADTRDNGLWLGWFLDDISVKDGEAVLFFDDGGDAVAPSRLTVSEGSGQYPQGWRETTAEFHSPIHCWQCDDDGDSDHVLVSPWITLPEVTDGDSITLSFWVYVDMPDYNGDGGQSLEDYYRVEISFDGLVWYRLIYDYARASIGADTGWIKMKPGIHYNGTLNLTDYNGWDIQLRWMVQKDDNDDGGNGSGLYLDDVLVQTVYSTKKAYTWRFHAGGVIWSSPAIGDDGTIYIGSTNDRLYAIEYDGSEKWHVNLGENVQCAPAIGEDGTIYAVTTDGKLHAVTPAGNIDWSHEISGSSYSSPAVGEDGTLYFGDAHWLLYAIRPDGTEKWRYDTADLGNRGSVNSPPSIGPDGTVYFGSRSSHVRGVDPATGQLRCFYLTGFWVESSPAIGPDNTVYVGSMDNKLYALRPDMTLNMVRQWTYQTGDDILSSSPAIGQDGTLYVGSEDKNLYAVNPDGTRKWVFATAGEVLTSPAVGSNGTIYFGSVDRKVYAVNPDGTEKWSYETGDEIHSSPAIDNGGILYIGSDDGYLYAFETDCQGLADSGWPKYRHDTRNTGNVYFQNTGINDTYDKVSTMQPDRIRLVYNYPNPFNASTTIRYDIPKASNVELTIHDVSGQRILTLVEEHRQIGQHRVRWNGKDSSGRDVSSGIYLYVLKIGNRRQTKKMILVR